LSILELEFLEKLIDFRGASIATITTAVALYLFYRRYMRRETANSKSLHPSAAKSYLTLSSNLINTLALLKQLTQTHNSPLNSLILNVEKE
jgi:uncharacterized membrane protein YdjX (TVP38/TMEM64 family)